MANLAGSPADYPASLWRQILDSLSQRLSSPDQSLAYRDGDEETVIQRKVLNTLNAGALGN